MATTIVLAIRKTDEQLRTKTVLLLFDPAEGPGDFDGKFSAIPHNSLGTRYPLVDWKIFEKVAREDYPAIHAKVSTAMETAAWRLRAKEQFSGFVNELTAEKLRTELEKYND